MAEFAEDDAADKGADNAEHDVEQAARALPVDDFAGDKTGDQPQDDPGRILMCTRQTGSGGTTSTTGAGFDPNTAGFLTARDFLKQRSRWAMTVRGRLSSAVEQPPCKR